MTERLYFTDSYLSDFEADVLACASVDGRFEVTLGATAFYPTGGGQPNDLGTLGDRAVLDVIDRDDQGIVHVLDGPLAPGARVRGLIDWPRRFDHMQQHSGQHVLSAAFESVCKARTESFHLGTASATIDLHRVVSPAEIAEAETEANRVVWQDREVHVRFSEASEAGGLRKESARAGTLRLIEVPEFDRSACGGTHVQRTGVIGIISVVGSEKFKGGTRVEFLCGNRALLRMRQWRDVFSDTSRVLSVLPEVLAPAIERLRAENKTLGRAVRDLQGQLAGHLAAQFVSRVDKGADGQALLVQVVPGWDTAGIKAVATAAVGGPGLRVALFSDAVPAQVVVARSPDVALDASAVVKALLAQFGGKGGGKPEMAQGGGLQGDPAQMLQRARELLQ
jgi:alanyl-tRNA synthetase